MEDHEIVQFVVVNGGLLSDFVADSNSNFFLTNRVL